MAVFETRMSPGSKFLLIYYNLCHCFNYMCWLVGCFGFNGPLRQ